MIEKLAVLACIILLTGVTDTIIYKASLDKNRLLENLVVGITLAAGCFGLFSMYESVGPKYKVDRQRIVVLVVGFLMVLIAFFALEGLLREYGRI